jgi:hypothetical protein
MRLAQIENGVVVNVIEVDGVNVPEWATGWPENEEAGPGWIVDGENIIPPAPPDPAPLTQDDYRLAVQAHIDATAIAKLYDSGTSCASYIASTNATWAAEAEAFVAWRDAVWTQVYVLWADPPDPVPTPEALVASLPAIVWP